MDYIQLHSAFCIQAHYRIQNTDSFTNEIVLLYATGGFVRLCLLGSQRAGAAWVGRLVVRVPAHELERDLSILSSYLIIYSLFTWPKLRVKEEAELYSAPSSGYTDGQAG